MMSVVDDRFTLKEVIGKVMIIHAQPDDFHTQPSGNSGLMIACGKIMCIKKIKTAFAGSFIYYIEV